MSKLLTLLSGLERLSITTTEPLAQPLTIPQVRRIANLTSLDELNDQDFELINQNLTAAKAYGYKAAELTGMLEIPDYVSRLKDQSQTTQPENIESDLSNVINLFPTCKLLTPRTAEAMAASTGGAEHQSVGSKTYSIQTLSNHNVTVTFEFRTNPMSKRVTTKLRLSISQALPVDTTIAWLSPQIDDDSVVSPILQCQLRAGNTEAVVTRIFEPNEWKVLPPAPEFGEVEDIEDKNR
jgi:hypothetical protein